MEDNGFTVKIEDVANLTDLKAQYQIPYELRSCHTAVVDGYVIEGHVPASEVRQLLSERPEIIGIAVAGMPVGSPGMEVAGYDAENFSVVAFDETGVTDIIATYP